MSVVANPRDAIYSSVSVLSEQPRVSVFGKTYVGIEFRSNDDRTRLTIGVIGDADSRRRFAQRLRDLAREIDAWRPG